MILLITFLLTYGALWLQKRSGDHCAVEEGVHEDGLKKASRIFHRRSRVLSQGRIATANARRWHVPSQRCPTQRQSQPTAFE